MVPIYFHGVAEPIMWLIASSVALSFSFSTVPRILRRMLQYLAWRVVGLRQVWKPPLCRAKVQMIGES